MANIYLIKSTSYRIINDEINKICKDNNNVTYFSLNEVSIYDVIDDASYFGLFDEPRIIVVKDTKYFGGKFNYEDESDALEKLFDNMKEDLTLIFICDNINSKKKLTASSIKKGAIVIDKSKLEDEELDNVIKEYLKNNEITVEKDVINTLKSNCLNNIDLIIQELDKLSLLSNHITLKTVNESGSIYIEYKNNKDEESNDKSSFDFSNAVVQKKFDEALRQFEKLLQKGVEVQQIIGLLASSYTTMYMVKRATQDKLTDEEIAKLFNFSNPKRVWAVRNNGKIYTIEQIKEIIILISELDKKIKTGYNPVYGMKEFLLNL